MTAPLQVQGTCVALNGIGVLLRGPAGAGKSDLALRLIEEGAVLVADDLCEIRREGERLVIDLPAAVDPQFRGKIERRGEGILVRPYFGPAPLGLVADLRPVSAVEMLAEPIEFLGLRRPLIVLDPFLPGAVATLRAKATQALVE
jgi:HPr kinase/phosphorylase